jgi:hypothetical protein
MRRHEGGHRGACRLRLIQRPAGIKYLPIYLAIAFAVAAPLVRARIRRGRR